MMPHKVSVTVFPSSSTQLTFSGCGGGGGGGGGSLGWNVKQTKVGWSG